MKNARLWSIRLGKLNIRLRKLVYRATRTKPAAKGATILRDFAIQTYSKIKGNRSNIVVNYYK